MAFVFVSEIFGLGVYACTMKFKHVTPLKDAARIPRTQQGYKCTNKITKSYGKNGKIPSSTVGILSVTKGTAMKGWKEQDHIVMYRYRSQRRNPTKFMMTKDYSFC
jgi:hypothetical protein